MNVQVIKILSSKSVLGFELYLTTDGAVKIGDYGINFEDYPTPIIIKTDEAVLDLGLIDVKVVATTNTELGCSDEFGGWYPIPQIPAQFVIDYIKSDGIDNIQIECVNELVEYLDDVGVVEQTFEPKPKLTTNNYVTIKQN